MKNKLLVGSLMLLALGLSPGLQASENDCFPACAEPAKSAVTIETPTEVKLKPEAIIAPRESASEPLPTKSCESNNLVQKAEALNDKVKPIRELVGYVRSPQGLAIKLVNDHIVKIPAWIGYAMDPIGSIKHRAIDEVRTRAKNTLAVGKDCDAAPVIVPFDEAINSKASI